jgi:hypothetical protein
MSSTERSTIKRRREDQTNNSGSLVFSLVCLEAPQRFNLFAPIYTIKMGAGRLLFRKHAFGYLI